MTAIWWIRRDLRLTDNPALLAAIAYGAVVPVFVLDPYLLAHTPARRQAFLFDSLRALERDLQARGGWLLVRRGQPCQVLEVLRQETGAEVIIAEEDFTPYARCRDAAVTTCVHLKLVQGQLVHHPDSILTSSGMPYTVFTPYSRTWKSRLPEVLQPRPAPELIPFPKPPAGDVISDLEPADFFPAGEAEAQHRLQAFLSGPIYEYGDGRNRLDLNGTSALSPYLRFGMLSMRQAAAGGLQAMNAAYNSGAEKSAESWLNELIWREFYISILYHYPSVQKESFRSSLRDLHWLNSPVEFEAWKQGRTGYPVVDAAMRQLLSAGWIHNRARMITASFLVKHLLIDWRWGERWFMENLVDGDLAANNGGWQWVAGTGTDAAPYFRVFNPIIQGRKFDPQGVYTRRWVGELAPVPQQYIHAPWEMPVELQHRLGCLIGKDYPSPLVEHDFARQRALDAYRQAKENKV